MSVGNRTLIQRAGEQLDRKVFEPLGETVQRRVPKLAKAPKHKLGRRVARTWLGAVPMALLMITSAVQHWHWSLAPMFGLAAIKLYSDEAFDAVVRFVLAWRGKGKDKE